MNRKIWIADDEQEILDFYQKIFEPKPTLDFFSDESEQAPEEEFFIRLFNDGLPLLEEFEKISKTGEQIPLCILDMRMTTKNGLEISESLRAIDQSVCIIIVTAFSDYTAKEIRQRLKENIYYIKKPFNPEELLSLVDSLTKSWNDRQSLCKHQKKLDSIICALRDSEARWQYALEGAGDGLWDWDVSSNEVYYSPQWKAMLGFEDQEIENSLKEWEKRVHPDDRQAVLESIDKHFSGETPFYSSEHRIACKDGNYKWILDRGKIISRDSDGNPIRVIGTHSDISSRKAAEKMIAQIRKQEENTASQIQQSLLLGNPPNHLPGIKVAAKSIPSLSVDGDFYDFYIHNDWCVDILIGDVMGKGIAAAIIGAALKSSFLRAQASFRSKTGGDHIISPLALVEIVHDDVVPHLMQVESFASFIYARFDLANSRLDIINCGHPYPILCRMREGSCREIGHNGMPMGFIREKNYEQRSYKIESDDAFFFFSDGLTDSLAYRDDDKSKRIIFDSLWSHRNSEPDTQINEILSTLYGGNPEKTFFDDVTCLGVKLAFDAKQLPVIQSSACFTYKLEELELMRKFIKEVYRGANNDILKAKEIPLLEIAATETFTNILKHTSSDNKGLEIELNIEILTDRVILTFAYFGSNPFIELADPLKSEENTGFGLYIIEHMVDQVLYTIDEKGRNCIVLIKKGTRY